MKNKVLFSILLVVSFSFQLLSQEISPSEKNKKIVILGSSVAAGWVTSYQEKYDMQNGYAYRLARMLKPKGWEVVNISIPGFDTKSTIERFVEDVLPLDPGYVFIGLSMSNEGLETEDPDSVFNSYRSGIKELVGLCSKNNILPVMGLCYSNDNYTEGQYAYLKKMNLLINSWDVASVNLLGVLDDGHGHFPEGYTFDPNHPDDRGHEEMFYAFVPDMFDALNAGKSLPSPELLNTEIGEMMNGSEFNQIYYVPDEVMHSFTVFFHFRSSHASTIISIQESKGKNTLSISKDGFLIYKGKKKEVSSEVMMIDREYYTLTFTHQFLTKESRIYLDGKMILTLEEQLEPVLFTFGDDSNTNELGQLLIYRGALNQEEIDMLLDGKLYQSSLEVASLLLKSDFTSGDNQLINYALSLGNAVVDNENLSQKTAEMTKKIETASSIRENELKAEHRQAIDLDPKMLDQYIGSYEIEPGDNFIVVKEDDKLFLDDHGRKAEILPEGDDQFFIQYPGDILVIFQKDDEGRINALILSINGMEMKARKLED